MLVLVLISIGIAIGISIGIGIGIYILLSFNIFRLIITFGHLLPIGMQKILNYSNLIVILAQAL